MRPVLAGIETEYGLAVEGRKVENQVQDSMRLVRALPDGSFHGWDYSAESPRNDLRGFQAKSLHTDPEDDKFDATREPLPAEIERSDRVLESGARFYNDHGHPEFATPECLSLQALVWHDLQGELTVLAAARALQEQDGKKVTVYKNNTDFHGSSYGTHENYLVRRSHSFQSLYEAVVPVLVSRPVLTGAGKVGSEARGPVRYQLSQRADFFTDHASVDTLFKRPVFNTRDEPHADSKLWARLHVISGDANRLPSCTRRKVGLVKIALALLESDRVPTWKIPDPVAAVQMVSRDAWGEGRIDLVDRGWTTPRQVLESYVGAYLDLPDQEPELTDVAKESLWLLECRNKDQDTFRKHVDWAAKLWLLEQFIQAEGLTWHDDTLKALDLQYHLLDPEESLYSALRTAGEVVVQPQDPPEEHTRAFARGLAVKNHKDSVQTLNWSSVTWKTPSGTQKTDLHPDKMYDPRLASVESTQEFIRILAGTA